MREIQFIMWSNSISVLIDTATPSFNTTQYPQQPGIYGI